MSCYCHQNRTAVAVCNNCGRALCTECANLFDPPYCKGCAAQYASEIRAEMIKNILISVALMLVGIFTIGGIGGVLLAGIPYGWSILNKIQPSMFLWLSWFGWILYFLIKLVVAYLIGIVALPIKLVIWIRTLNKMKAIDNNASS